MSFGHLAAAFPVNSPSLPTPPQIPSSPSPPSSSASRSSMHANSSAMNGTTTSSTPTVGPAGTVGSPSGPPHCCENGRPVMTDPHTGQTVCSCQYSSALLSSYPRLPALAASSIFGAGTSYPGGTQSPYGMSLGAEGSAFYTPLGANGSNIRDGTDPWRSLAQPSIYDTPPMGFYPYGPGYGGLDLNARRKNATRESTNTLKAWLQEHIKNPYPTKGEKIMLAIITKMTLTQVSTWFANARRRLKKENKMTWSPRNRSEDGDDEDDDENDDCDDQKKNNNNNKGDGDSIDVGTESSDCNKSSHNDGKPREPEVSHCRLSPELPRGPAYISNDPSSVVDPESGKPKIWSVTDFLGSANHAKDPQVGGAFSKLDALKSVADMGQGHMTSTDPSRVNPLLGRSTNHNGLSSLSNPAHHHISPYQTTLGYAPGAYPYSLSSYGGGKLLRPSVSSGAVSRFNPFPPVRSLAMDSPYVPRRDVTIGRDGD